MEFFKLYDRVFDENKQIRACGREACMDLIKYCANIIPNTDFGDEKTGIMNVGNILAIADTLELEKDRC